MFFSRGENDSLHYPPNEENGKSVMHDKHDLHFSLCGGRSVWVVVDIHVSAWRERPRGRLHQLCPKTAVQPEASCRLPEPIRPASLHLSLAGRWLFPWMVDRTAPSC